MTRLRGSFSSYRVGADGEIFDGVKKLELPAEQSGNLECGKVVASVAETTSFKQQIGKMSEEETVLRKRSSISNIGSGYDLCRKAPARSHEVSGSSTGDTEKAKKKEQVKRERPVKKPRRKGPEPFEPKDMPQDLRYYIEATLGGTDIFPVSQKTLTNTDVKPHYSRVFLLKADLGFLNEKEKAVLEHPAVKDRAIPVKVLDPATMLDPAEVLNPAEELDPHDKLRELTFTRWELKKNDGGNASTIYVLTKAGWARLVEDNKLDTDDEIQIWSFRVGSRLHMAVVVAKRA